MILRESVKFKFVPLFTNQSYHARLIVGKYATDIRLQRGSWKTRFKDDTHNLDGQQKIFFELQYKECKYILEMHAQLINALFSYKFFLNLF